MGGASIIPILGEEGKGQAPKIVIAPSPEKKEEQKKFIRDVERMGDTLRPDGTIISERNKDMFMGGPHDGLICSHQPNGPRAHNDQKGMWADYYLKDKMYIPEAHGRVEGYHLYSTVRNIMGTDGHINKGHASQWGLGARGPNFRKMYYYIGFFETGLLACDGVHPSEFNGILTSG